MAESSDPLLLSKPAQKLVKGSSDGLPGTLLITSSKVKWLPNDRNASKPAIVEIASISKQQQAPGKPFLRILSSAEPLGLAFASEADKNEVLEFMKQLKPAAAAGPSTSGKASTAGLPSDAQTRQLFGADKDMETLYSQLVTSGILSEADFWKTRQSAVNKISGGKAGGGAGGARQRVGLSSVMHEVEQLHDGSTERVNIHLTPKDIQRIFLERPEVHRAFLANVPNACSEKDFWQRYFKLEYKKAARRKRLASTQRLDVTDEELDAGDEMFAPFRKQVAEQEATANKAKLAVVDPTVNLAANFAERWAGGFGVVHSGVEAAVTAGAAGGTSSGGGGGPSRGGSRALESLARELNRHAAHVLGGAPEDIDGDGTGGEGTTTAAIAARVTAAAQRSKLEAKGGAGAGEVGEETLRGWQARAASALEDLSLEEKAETTPLDVRDPRAFFGAEGGAVVQKTAAEAAVAMEEDVKKGGAVPGGGSGAAVMSLSVVDAAALPDPPCDPALAEAVVMEVGGEEDAALIAEFGPVAASAMGTSPQAALTSVMLEFFRMEALKTNELLRHMWACLPLISDPRKTKAAGLASHLEKQRNSLAAHMASRSGTVQQVYVTQMVRPLVAAIDAVLDRHHEAVEAERMRSRAGLKG